jgi:hypothetical protein
MPSVRYPSGPETPEVPGNLVVTGGAPEMVFTDWDDAGGELPAGRCR